MRRCVVALGRDLSIGFLVLVLLLLLVSCLFDSGKGAEFPVSDFDLSRLRNAANPLVQNYSVEAGKSLVGVKFAFKTMHYAAETDSNIEVFHEQVGAYPAMAGAYFDLTSQPRNLKAFLDAVHAKGCIPYVTLDPKDWDNEDIAYQKTFLGKIVRGEFDAPLVALVGVLRDFAHPVMFRYAHEMNGDWYPYGGGGDADGNGIADGPEKFIEAWRYVHRLFEREGAANLIWIFCPNAEDFPVKEWNRPFRYFPGSDYVDLVFVDAYEHHDKREQGLEQVLAYFYNEMGHFLSARETLGDTSIPAFGLGEFGTNRMDKGRKVDWYVRSLDYLGQDDRIQFHIQYNSQNRKEDFSLTGLGEAVKSAYRNIRFQFRLFVPVAI